LLPPLTIGVSDEAASNGKELALIRRRSSSSRE
jgi:hypothetical protein